MSSCRFSCVIVAVNTAWMWTGRHTLFARVKPTFWAGGSAAMKLKFTKMQGLGNDFVIIDATKQQVQLTVETIRFLAHRNYGIGADQVLLLEPLPNDQGQGDFFYYIYNADGSRAYQCGNGVRCLAKYVHDHYLVDSRRKELWFRSSPIKTTRVWIENDGEVSVDMGEPIFTPAQVPFVPETRGIRADNGHNLYRLDYDYAAVCVVPEIAFDVVSMGNPHAVIDLALLQGCSSAELQKIGAFLAAHASFPESVNVNFLQQVAPNHIKLSTYERGSGMTLACGSGACAAVAVGRRWGRLAEQVMVEMLGGKLNITWSGSGHSLSMKGAAVEVFAGEIEV